MHPNAPAASIEARRPHCATPATGTPRAAPPAAGRGPHRAALACTLAGLALLAGCNATVGVGMNVSLPVSYGSFHHEIGSPPWSGGPPW
jgi:hypothetical protein